MKSLFFTLLITLFSLNLAAQDVKSKAQEAIKSGNSKALSAYFAQNIDLSVNDEDDVFSKAQAEQILKKFFSSNKPSGFKVVHQGESKVGTKYVIGELTTSGGKYRVTFNMKDKGGKLVIHQLSIE